MSNAAEDQLIEWSGESWDPTFDPEMELDDDVSILYTKNMVNTVFPLLLSQQDIQKPAFQSISLLCYEQESSEDAFRLFLFIPTWNFCHGWLKFIMEIMEIHMKNG